MSTGNQEYIRDMNRALVLEAIANHPPLSRADLAKMLHLTKATVSTMFMIIFLLLNFNNSITIVISHILIWASLILAIVSAVDYIVNNKQVLK